MTAIEESTENVVAETTESTEAQPTAPNYPTYRELAFAVWKLAYRLCFDEDAFCSDGANEYLTRLSLPNLVHVDGNEALKDKYLTAWFDFANFRATEWTEQDDASMRTQLARRLRRQLEQNEPKSRETMSAWLEELGLEGFTPPPRHVGRYAVSYTESREVTSARIAEALRREFPNLDVQVTYDRRIA